tara:strand:- start:154 stop:402 length:249 start_codon:yes stop_codon:yes gene_type:complete
MIEMKEGCQFLIDLNSDDTHRNYNLGWYNLIISIRDLRLYIKGIKPHRRWKITPLKEYFGIKGSKDKMLEQLTQIKTIIEKG